MIELNFYSAVLVPLAGLISYAIWSRLRMPVEYRQISSHVPSVTKSFWSEIVLSWKLAKLQPKDIIPFITDLLKENGPVVHFNLAGRSYVLLNDPDDLKVLLSNTQYIKKGPEYDMLKPWLNEGLLLSSGQKWQSRRKLLTNTFHFKTLDMYNPSINKHSRILVDKLLDASANEHKEISITEYVTLCSLDIICETIMGTEMNAQKGKSAEYVHSIKSACKSVIERIFKFWLWNDLVFKMSKTGQSFFKSIKVLHEYTDNVIKSKRASLNNSGIEKVQSDSKFGKTQKKSFLDLLLNVLNDTPNQMSDKDIREEVDTFLFEGHDTTSIAMTIVLVLLGMHPDIQERARDELRSIFGYSNRDATMEDLNAMKYLEAVIKESLRMYPSVPAITRELDKPLHLNKYIIPPMTTITVYPFILHRNEEIYPNAVEFIPERFLDEENKAKFVFGYLPFSAGARNCIGQKYAMNQIKIVVSTILRNAEFESIGRKEDIQISSQLIIRIELSTETVTEMIELNVYSVVLLPLAGLISYAIWLRLRMPLEYRQISSHVPSVTKNFWSEILLSWKLAMMQPKDILSFLMDLTRTNGPVIHFNLSGRSYVLLNDPDDLKILLSNTQHITKGPEYEMLTPWLNEGLLLSSGQKWHSRRKLLTNAFHFKTLDMYNPSINKHSRILVDKLLDASANNDEKISIPDYVTLCSLDIICETIMGTEMNAQEGKSVQYVHSIKCACRSVIDRIFKFWLWNDLIYKTSGSGQRFFKSIKLLHDFTDNVIRSKRLSLNNSETEKVQPGSKFEKPQKKSFLDLLLNVLNDSPDQMNDRDIREEVDTFLFEGHDTSSISMTMTLVLLGIYPDIQEQARDELRNIFGDSDRDATMEDLNAMKYIEAVIKESLRLYPSVPGITRHLQTPLQLKNYIIPPMTTIAVYPFILHRSEDIYPNAEEFIPERFLDEENKAKFQFGYLPFSAGARNCIGQKYAMNQMKIVVSTILRYAKFETLGVKEDIQISTQLVLRIESLPKMKFVKL
ncbi:hypothetical protein ACI65C_001413 [Semiaphis heraclei]